MALLTTIIFGRWASISTFVTGAKAGAVIGLLTGAFFDLIMLGTTNISTPTAAMADILVNGIIGMFVGGAVGWILGKTAD
jgi:hypothetical protein